MWILAIMIYGARYEVSFIPYLYFDSKQTCEAWKGRESRDLKLPLTCIHEGEA